MTPLFKKLNYKTQGTIVSIHHPDSFLPELKSMSEEATIIDSLSKAKHIGFVIVFAIKQKEVNVAAEQIAKKAAEDAVIWFCYPKGTSKKYTCEFNRDNGWAKLGELGYEPVRAVAIDEDWSALRFRKAEHIKTMTRSFAMTEVGKKKVGAVKKK
ncbi:MAG: hypothetical protein K2Q24_04750 [Chitinophagaceae bacterium]|jgi:hypothetical protein|nr:hypothetical protein [Chitinophagaceae bacterium]